ncbi:MAG: hypothetical protein ABSG53_20480, partial [Thermoguttaceae bacterium]
MPWQLLAAIVAGILASVGIFGYLIATKSPEGAKPGTQAKVDAPRKKADEGTTPKKENPTKPEPPISEPQRAEVEPKPDPNPEPEQPKPEPKPESKPEPVTEPPEKVTERVKKVAERVKEAFGNAKSPADFRAVAVDALKLIERANTIGKQDVAESVAALALSAARKAEDDELAKTATMCILEPGTKLATTNKSSFDNRDTISADQRKRRLPAPDVAAQEQALKRVRELFKDKSSSATTGEQRKALAQELLQKAQTTNGDVPAQYVMLKEAGRFAIQAKDADFAFQVIEEMETRFEADALDLKVKWLTTICKSIGPHEQLDAIVGSLLALIEEAVTKEHYDTAKLLGTMATDLARKSKDASLLQETAARKATIIKEVAEIQKARADVAEAVDSLDKTATDPAANLAVGKYRCFVQGKWNKGIPMLALGADPALKDLALKELKG